MWFLITVVSFGNKYCIGISQMEVPLEPSWRVQKSALGHDSYFTLAVYTCVYMHAFQGKAVRRGANDPYECVHAVAYVCVMRVKACDCNRWITHEWSSVFLSENYSRAFKQCVYSMCEREVIIPACNVIHRNRLISSGTRSSTASVVEDLCLYVAKRRGFLEK